MANLLVSQAIFLLVLSGVVSSHYLGLRLFSLNEARLSAANDIARSFSQFITDVRSARMVRLGQGDLASFTEVGRDVPQQGRAIQLYPGADTNSYILYYFDIADNRLKRRATNGVLSVVVGSVSNQVIFTAESATGQVLTNRRSQCVIGVNLSLYAFANGGQKVGVGNLFREYRLQTKVASPVSE